MWFCGVLNHHHHHHHHHLVSDAEDVMCLVPFFAEFCGEVDLLQGGVSPQASGAGHYVLPCD
jgi:hypothetical protein